MLERRLPLVARRAKWGCSPFIKNHKHNDEIVYFEANINYSILHFADGTTKKSAYNLLKFERILKDNTEYKRIHKSFIVNVNLMKEMDLDEKTFTLKNGIVLPISRRKLRLFANNSAIQN